MRSQTIVDTSSPRQGSMLMPCAFTCASVFTEVPIKHKHQQNDLVHFSHAHTKYLL